MISKNDLKREREKSFGIWFDRFLKNKQIEKNIEIANKKGFKSINIDISNFDKDDNTVRRMKDALFVENLQRVFPEFRITKKCYTNKGFLFGREYVKDSGIRINISWVE